MRHPKPTVVKTRRAVAKTAAVLPKRKAQKGPVTIVKMRKGFAVMTKAERIRIATMGGEAVSKNTRHMAEIGKVGGRNRTLTPEQRQRARLRAAA